MGMLRVLFVIFFELTFLIMNLLFDLPYLVFFLNRYMAGIITRKELPAVRRAQPITKRPKFLQQPMSNYYNSYMVNNNNTKVS